MATDPSRPIASGIRLVAADMDGTLLDADGEIPDGLWALLTAMRARGIVFAPASGRQYATLRRLFERDAAGMPFIAENGAFVVRDDEEISSATIDGESVTAVLDAMRALGVAGGDVGVVVCAKRCAYVERSDEAFLDEVRTYYAAYEVIDDLRTVDAEIIKLAIFDFADAATSTAPALAALAETHQVVVSGQHWVDVMARSVNKGVALRALQEDLGITAAQTVAFGDYLNDLEMLQAADLSYAMQNAHPTIARAARFHAPHHADGGVITVLRDLLGLPAAE